MLGKIYTVWCDVNGPRCHSWVSQQQKSKEARAEARRAGWKRCIEPGQGRMIDVCPGCQPQG